ncbi:HoxN/HupN/NixA family nickel/cobalt transporter [Paraburkholderia sp. BCC1885]|uniref:HoxN/HupN/NixA family nickel/cobalt transporter n=1 Tax=Paraburkholderia sp. BCC1885 TaxID=2562669 RepID=UPI0011824223|nr:HoxN/HupN/NixA family nickel/cobalt transporter [Paraburkholderia sp. BCC1885]
MLHQLSTILSGSDARVRHRLFGIYGVLIAFNALAWIWALAVFHQRPVLLGTALIAYGFGLRHAVDADHIAAIDNVTRKLMQERKRPVAVGFYFSLGHSTIIVIASLAVAVVATALSTRFSQYKELGGTISTLVSTGFLFTIALLNLFVLKSIVQTWRNVRRGGAYVDDDFDALLANRGFLARLFRPLLHLVTRSWHMFPLGFLFGLGFDTATEVSLLGMSATQAAHGISPWTVMVFPALFSAGMSLVDTLDGHLMLGAYGWAYMKPVRKLYYNMTITSVSVIVALLVGTIEALGLMSDQFGLRGRVWDAIGTLNDHFGTLGYIIIGVFAASWLASMLLYRGRQHDQLDTAR